MSRERPGADSEHQPPNDLDPTTYAEDEQFKAYGMELLVLLIP